MEAEKADFSVEMRRKEVVAAVLPMQEHWLPLSNLDLLLPPLDVGVFFCYKKPESSATGEDNIPFTFTSMVGALKKALAQALVSYYAFAGEVVKNTVGEPELLCNNCGVDFHEAFADIQLHHLNLHKPDETIQGKLVPNKNQGVLSVQATELKCGGLVVACTFDHRVADAYSANMFLVSWAEMAHSKPLSLLPSFRRSLLNPRHPRRYDPSMDSMYLPISALPPPNPCTQADHLVSRIYYVEAEQLSELQALASEAGQRKTKLEAFTAFLWKMIAAGEGGSFKRCKMGIVVDGRTRLSGGEGKEGETMKTYFGNVLSIPFAEKTAGELREKPLSWAAEAVHNCLESAVTEEHFLGLIDWVEARRPEPTLAKIYAGGSSEEDCGPAVVVSSGQRFPVAKMDFGWGKAAFGSYHFPWGGDAGYVMPMPSPVGNGDWIVYMHLLKGQLEAIETQAAHLFRPFATHHLYF